MLVGGRIRGIWRTRRTRGGLVILLQLFGGPPLSEHARRALRREARAAAEFSGQSLLDVESTEAG